MSSGTDTDTKKNESKYIVIESNYGKESCRVRGNLLVPLASYLDIGTMIKDTINDSISKKNSNAGQRKKGQYSATTILTDWIIDELSKIGREDNPKNVVEVLLSPEEGVFEIVPNDRIGRGDDPLPFVEIGKEDDTFKYYTVKYSGKLTEFEAIFEIQGKGLKKITYDSITKRINFRKKSK